MHYTSPKHERLYRNVARGRGYRPRTLAALFLLTAHRKLWRKWCKAIDNHDQLYTSVSRHTACEQHSPVHEGEL